MNRKGFLGTPGLILLTVLLPVAMLMTSSGFAQAPGAQNTSGFLALSGEEAANFDLPSDMQLIQSSYNVQNGLTYERYQQYFGVAQVLGAQVTLYIDDSGTIATVIGAHYPDIAPANFARLSGANARAVVDRDVGAGGNRNVDLLINPETGRYFHRIETQRPYSRWFHWIDADNGRVLNKYDAIETHDIGVKGDAKNIGDLTTYHGSGRPQNRGYWLQSFGNRQLTYDDGNNGGVANIMIDSGTDNDWHDDLRQPAGVDAHFYARVVDDYYQMIHSRNSFNNLGASMVSIVHIGDNLSNAFWNGNVVAYGDGDGVEFLEFSGSLDVVGHEWTHAVTDYTSNLIYQNESGALNESFSDQMGNSIEFYAHANDLDPTVGPDWLVAEDISLFEDAEPGYRNMADPEEDGSTGGYYPARFPDHYSEWFPDPEDRDNGGVHINSGIPNHAYYLLVNGGLNASCADTEENHNDAHCDDSDDSEDTQDNNLNVIGIGLADAEKIFYQGFTGLNSSATLCDARWATEAVANSSFPAHSPSVANAWVAVGLTDTVCGAPDTTEPAAPMNLMASAGDGTVSLNWVVNIEPDLDGYHVYRSTTSGGPYDPINTSLVGENTYSDSTVSNETTYYYVVTAVDKSTNASGDSNEVSATPLSNGGTPTAIHVEAIVLTTQNQGGGSKSAQAIVTILDDLDNPVSGATVTGDFTGGIIEPDVTGTTDNDGQAILTTIITGRGRLSFTFCVDVDGVSGDLPYDSDDNATNVDSCPEN